MKLKPKEPHFYGSTNREERVHIGSYVKAQGEEAYKDWLKVRKQGLCGLSLRRQKKAQGKDYKDMGRGERRLHDHFRAQDAEDYERRYYC